jgi:sulfite exporter TauE/SafE
MQGFLLGLANGVTCLSNCAPVVVPLLLAEGQEVKKNFWILSYFLGGRLCGYLLFSVAAWATNRVILESIGHRSLVFGVTYIVLSGMMLFLGLSPNALFCPGSWKGMRARLLKKPALFPAGMGLLTGASPCVPLLLAFTGAAAAGSLSGSLFFFLTFFLGTAFYFIPFPLMGIFSNFMALRTVGKYALAIIAIYYLYSGIIFLAGGLGQL